MRRTTAHVLLSLTLAMLAACSSESVQAPTVSARLDTSSLTLSTSRIDPDVLSGGTATVFDTTAGAFEPSTADV